MRRPGGLTGQAITTILPPEMAELTFPFEFLQPRTTLDQIPAGIDLRDPPPHDNPTMLKST